ncbi:hypothetical protein EV361DRAFT_874328 [Lentinula raphanica]|nr:hypothetical protein EV361DRAFT_874328 [Lentinula raphanica]
MKKFCSMEFLLIPVYSLRFFQELWGGIHISEVSYAVHSTITLNSTSIKNLTCSRLKFRASKLSAAASSSSLDNDDEPSSLSQSSQSFHFQPVLTSNPSLSQPKLGRPPKISSSAPSRVTQGKEAVIGRKRGQPPGTGRHQRQAKAMQEEQVTDFQARDSDHPASKKRRRKESPLPEVANQSHAQKNNTSSEPNPIDLTAAPPEVLPFPASPESIDSTASSEVLLDSEVDDDEDIGLAHEGLGTEDGEDGDDDDDNDNNATHDNVTHSPSDNNTNSNRRRVSYTLPAWLQSEFEHCVQTSGPDNRKHDNRPPLYRDCESFYFLRPAKFFILTRNQ